MTTKEAWAITGNAPRSSIRNMVFALSLHPWLNNEEDRRQLQAAKIALRTKNPRYLPARRYRVDLTGHAHAVS
jgi:hypothetical protein